MGLCAMSKMCVYTGEMSSVGLCAMSKMRGCTAEMVSVNPCEMSKDLCVYWGDGKGRGPSLIPKTHVKSWLWWGTFIVHL